MSRLLAKDRVTTSVAVVLTLLVIQRVASAARGIVFARVMGTEQYGIYYLSFFLIPIVVIAASLGIPSAFGRLIPRYEQRGAVKWFLRRTYAVTITLGIVAAAAIILAPGFFSNVLYGDPTHTRVITLAAICVPLMLVFRNVSSTFLGLRLFRASSVFEFTQVAIYAAIGTVLVIMLGSATSGIFSYAISFLLVIALFVPVLARYLAHREPLYRALDEEGFYRQTLRLCIWLMVSPILGQVFHYVDRLSIQRLMFSSDQGIYSATVGIAQMLSAVGLAVNNVIYPHLSATWEHGKRDEAVRNLDLAIRTTTVGLLILGLVLVLLGDFVIRLLLGEAYAPGAQVLPYLVVFYLFSMSLWLFGVFSTLVEKTYVNAVGLVLALPLNVALNLMLIPRMGILGAAVATMLSYLAMWLIVVAICRRLGFRARAKTLVVSLMPFALLLPAPWPALVVAVLVILSLATPLIFTADERALAASEVVRFVRKARGKEPPLAPPPPDRPKAPRGG
jgi:O-antigen/teichoic acid export membrane protein